MTHYVIHGGAAGSKRMETVARAYWPTTLPLLQRAGIREGLNCLDLGCGAGEVTFEIARLVGPSGSAVGMDMDGVKLEIARQRVAREGVGNIEFRQANVFEWDDDSVDGWTALFLVTTVATSLTGFLFPFTHLLPSHVIGIISLLALAVAILARYALHLAGAWRTIYVITAMIALYLNVFVLIFQGFLKVPALNAMAPTQSEPPFLVTQLLVMVIFIVLTILAAKKFRPEPVQAAA